MKKNKWIVKVFIITFIISLIFSGISNLIASNSNIYIIALLIILTIAIGILFDIIGTSVLIAEEAVFHAKSSKKIKGSKEALKLIKNSEKISNFCNDIIGDICSIVCGSLGAVLALYVSNKFKLDLTITSFLICAISSSATVGGKAIGKTFALKRNDKVIFIVGKSLSKRKHKKRTKTKNSDKKF